MIGIQRRQWLLLFLALAVSILLNGAGIWKDIGTDAILHGAYSPYYYASFGIKYNPLPKILLYLLLDAIPLGLLAWLMLFLSNRPFFRKQPLALRIFETLLTAVLIAAVFAIITGFFMPLTWLPEFHDYLLGLPASPFVMEWSVWVVFPMAKTPGRGSRL